MVCRHVLRLSPPPSPGAQLRSEHNPHAVHEPQFIGDPVWHSVTLFVRVRVAIGNPVRHAECERNRDPVGNAQRDGNAVDLGIPVARRKSLRHAECE